MESEKIRKLNDHQLLTATENLVQTEREILLSLLHHLQEIDRRKLYSALKFKSLFEYVVKKLGYSEDQACRRISAMRMLKSFSTEASQLVESKINEGTLCLTHLNMAQNHFKKEEQFLNQKISMEQKIEILEKLENTSTREAERIVIELSSAPVQIPPETIKPLTAELSELKTVLNRQQLEKIQKLKGLLAHKNPKMELNELLDILLDLGIKEFDPGQKIPRSYQGQKHQTKQFTKTNALTNESIDLPKSPAAAQVKKYFQPDLKQNPRFISAEVRREIWSKYQSRCVNCQSTFALEIDHILPIAMGGSSDLENLRLTCRSCNQRSAWRILGSQIMDRHVP